MHTANGSRAPSRVKGRWRWSGPFPLILIGLTALALLWILFGGAGTRTETAVEVTVANRLSKRPPPFAVELGTKQQVTADPQNGGKEEGSNKGVVEDLSMLGLRPAGQFIINGKDRTPSDPFVTGDGFREACLPYIFDETANAKLGTKDGVKILSELFSTMPSGHPVFVQTHLLAEFLDKVHKPILNARDKSFRYVLVTHNSDYSAPWEYSNTRGKHAAEAKSYADQRLWLLDGGVDSPTEPDKSTKYPAPSPRLHAWFGQNLMMQHHALRAIPIGIENRYNKYGAHPEVYYSAMLKAVPFAQRSKLLFLNFNDKTNPHERGIARRDIQMNFAHANGKLTMLSNYAPPPKSANRRLILESFLESVGQHQFVVAPHGHGVDTHRLWEALYMGCVPITLASAMDSTLGINPSALKGLEGDGAVQNATVPILTVKAYAEVTPEWLELQRQTLVQRFPYLKEPPAAVFRAVPAASMKFWREEIHRFRSGTSIS